MQRGRILFWTIAGSIVAAVAVVISLVLVNSGAPPKAASSPVHHITASPSSQASKSAPVVVPVTSSTTSYLADLKPSGKLAGRVNLGPVKISGSIYPKSISFYCNVGDPTAFPEYKLKQGARRFQAIIGLAGKWPPHFSAGIILLGDGHTLRTLSVSGPKPKTVDVNVAGVHTLQLECFGSGTSSTAGWAVAVAWGNARISKGH